MNLIKCGVCSREISSSARVCPGCGHPVPAPVSHGKRIGAKKIIAIALAGVAIISFIPSQIDQLPSNSQLPNASDQPSIASQPEPYKTTVGALITSYDANEVATEKAINGAPVQMTGRIASIELDFKKAVVLEVYADSPLRRVSVDLSEGQEDKAAKLVKGQSIEVICQRVKRILGVPMASDCHILSVGDSIVSNKVFEKESVFKSVDLDRPVVLVGKVLTSTYEDCCAEGKSMQKEYRLIELREAINFKGGDHDDDLKGSRRVQVSYEWSGFGNVPDGVDVEIQCKRVIEGLTGHYALPLYCEVFD